MQVTLDLKPWPPLSHTRSLYKVEDDCRRITRQNLPSPLKNEIGKLCAQSEIGNVGYGYVGVYDLPQLMNMVGGNPMFMPALNQNSIAPPQQSFGLSGAYEINTVNPNMIASYGSQLGLAGGLGAY